MKIHDAGRVQRCHTLELLKPETVAEHSWGVAALVATSFRREATKELLIAAIFHDIGEKNVGDVPATTKWRMSPECRKELELLESEYRQALLGYDPLDELSEREKKILSYCDMLDFQFKMAREMSLGNESVDVAYMNAKKAAEERHREIIRHGRD